MKYMVLLGVLIFSLQATERDEKAIAQTISYLQQAENKWDFYDRIPGKNAYVPRINLLGKVVREKIITSYTDNEFMQIIPAALENKFHTFKNDIVDFMLSRMTGAYNHGYEKLMRALVVAALKGGAQTSGKEGSAWDYFSNRGQDDIPYARALLDLKVKIPARNGFFKDPFLFTVNSPELAELLIAQGCSPQDINTSWQRTALHAAAHRPSQPALLTLYLKKYHLDVHGPNKDDREPLEYMVEQWHCHDDLKMLKEKMEVLLDHGADEQKALKILNERPEKEKCEVDEMMREVLVNYPHYKAEVQRLRAMFAAFEEEE